MREDLILKLSEIIENATNGIKYEMTNKILIDRDELMINIIVSLLNHNIRELNEIMKEEE